MCKPYSQVTKAPVDADGAVPLAVYRLTRRRRGKPKGAPFMNLITRLDPPTEASEPVMLTAFLDYHRATLLQKISRLDEDQVRRSIVPSGITLLGMLKHLAYVERWWFQMVFAAADVPAPWTDADPDADWRIEPGETVESVTAFYLAEVARSREIAAAANLGDHARRNGFSAFTLRWIMIHMIEETARHNGHADLLRESIDGRTGE
jgi:uncharacterized damage-inducible protein DinB